MLSDYFTITEAAKTLKLNPKTVWRQVREGTVRTIRKGKMHLIAPSDLTTIKVRPAHGVKRLSK